VLAVRPALAHPWHVAALALALGGLLMLALPGDVTALVLLIVGVLTWTVVVLLSVRLQLRR
jgi:hypothetical protein